MQYDTQTPVDFSKELAMTRFIPAFTPRQEYSAQSAANTTPVWSNGVLTSRTLAGMLLAATLSLILVVADKLIESWADGDTLLGWVSLWMAVFVTMALFAPTLRRWSGAVARKMADSYKAARQREEEATLWDMAQHDPRILAEIRCAQSRSTD